MYTLLACFVVEMSLCILSIMSLYLYFLWGTLELLKMPHCVIS